MPSAGAHEINVKNKHIAVVAVILQIYLVCFLVLLAYARKPKKIVVSGYRSSAFVNKRILVL